MRIMSIGFSARQNVPANFKGLWGKENVKVISESQYDSSQMCYYGTDESVVTKEYFPFKDETDEEIRKVVEENEKPGYWKSDYAYDISDSITRKKVEVMPKLDISEDEYNRYRNDDLLSKDENSVEDKLKLAGLKKYLLRNIKR